MPVELDVVAHAVNHSRGKRIGEFEDSLVYRAISGKLRLYKEILYQKTNKTKNMFLQIWISNFLKTLIIHKIKLITITYYSITLKNHYIFAFVFLAVQASLKLFLLS